MLDKHCQHVASALCICKQICLDWAHPLRFQASPGVCANVLSRHGGSTQMASGGYHVGKRQMSVLPAICAVTERKGGQVSL